MKRSKVKRFKKIAWIGSYHLQGKFKLLAGKFIWGNKAKHCWVMSTNFLFSKVCWQRPAIFCLYTSSKLSRPQFEFSLKGNLSKSFLLYWEILFWFFVHKKYHMLLLTLEPWIETLRPVSRVQFYQPCNMYGMWMKARKEKSWLETGVRLHIQKLGWLSIQKAYESKCQNLYPRHFRWKDEKQSHLKCVLSFLNFDISKNFT